MKRFSVLYVTLMLTSLTQLPVWAQGCSDAGFCTIGGLKQHGPADTNATNGQTFALLLPVGLGDEGVFVFTPGLQYDRQLSANWGIQAKLTANYARGDLGSVGGLGDVFLSGTYTLPTKTDWTTALTLGTKLPLNKGDLKAGGQSLPMQYQSSLGTLDLIAGFSVNSRRWQFSAGWQQPLTGANANTFLPSADGRLNTSAYPPSNQFTRKADLLARAAYALPVQNKFSINAGLLGIYHVAEDTYRDGANSSLAIAGSRGLTLNATLAGWWTVNTKTRIGFTAGIPLVVRAVRPDGLTRSVVFAPEISWRF